MTQVPQAGAVVMAVHRPELRLLERQLRSLQAQEFANWSCVVGIDGFDQETHRYVLGLVGEDPRFSVHHFEDNVGVYRHFERLLALVPADEVGWVALADQDDNWYPDKLAVLLAALAEPGVTAVVGRARVVREGRGVGMTKRHVGGFASTLLINQVTGSLSIFRSAVLRDCLPFPPANDDAIHDHWLAVCAAARGRIAHVDAVLQDYVQHCGNVIGESGRHTARDVVKGARAAGGLLRLVDVSVLGRWDWRIQMARTLRERGLPVAEVALTEAVANGHLSALTIRATLVGIARREVTVIEGVALLAAAARWPNRGTRIPPG